MVALSKGLGGKGLSNLLFEGADEENEDFFQCDINSIIPNKHQPRNIFKDENLEELAQSIRENGVIQPLIVVKSELKDGEFELIAGERRLRASKLVGLREVPVVVKDLTEEENLLELAIIENVQRTDLSPIEEAAAYKKLIDIFGYTQEQTAEKVGKKRSTISNLIRLLKLPEYIQENVSQGIISEGHARSLLRVVDDPNLLKDIQDIIISKKLSVRQAEALVKKMLNEQLTKKAKAASKEINGITDSYKQALVNQLENKLSAKVKLNQSGTRGTIELEYYSIDDLERLIGILTSEDQ